MKKIAILLFATATLLSGCEYEIIGKEFTDKDCICKYDYVHAAHGNISFEDSCSLYRVGDKLGEPTNHGKCEKHTCCGYKYQLDLPVHPKLGSYNGHLIHLEEDAE